MQRELYVLFTMDVEPTTTAAGVSGPASDEAGMNAVENYQSVLASYGYQATYFVHPELVHAYPDFYKHLANDGATIGLHLHTTKFAAAKQPCELGGLTADQQQHVLRLARDMFEQGMGRRPALFRPGCFSANDATFPILTELGFVGGGVSIPGRIWPQRHCIWAGAYPYTHFAHEAFRQAEGSLPFVNIPLSVDLTSPLRWNPVGFHHYPDLRPGGVYSEEDEIAFDRRALLHNILGRMVEDDPPLKTLVVDVHNDRDFTSAQSHAGQHLREVLDAIGPECEALGLTLRPSTYDQVVAAFAKRQA